MSINFTTYKSNPKTIINFFTGTEFLKSNKKCIKNSSKTNNISSSLILSSKNIQEDKDKIIIDLKSKIRNLENKVNLLEKKIEEQHNYNNIVNNIKSNNSINSTNNNIRTIIHSIEHYSSPKSINNQQTSLLRNYSSLANLFSPQRHFKDKKNLFYNLSRFSFNNNLSVNKSNKKEKTLDKSNTSINQTANLKNSSKINKKILKLKTLSPDYKSNSTLKNFYINSNKKENSNKRKKERQNNSKIYPFQNKLNLCLSPIKSIEIIKTKNIANFGTKFSSEIIKKLQTENIFKTNLSRNKKNFTTYESHNQLIRKHTYDSVLKEQKNNFDYKNEFMKMQSRTYNLLSTLTTKQ